MFLDHSLWMLITRILKGFRNVLLACWNCVLSSQLVEDTLHFIITCKIREILVCTLDIQLLENTMDFNLQNKAVSYIIWFTAVCLAVLHQDFCSTSRTSALLSLDWQSNVNAYCFLCVWKMFVYLAARLAWVLEIFHMKAKVIMM